MICQHQYAAEKGQANTGSPSRAPDAAIRSAIHLSCALDPTTSTTTTIRSHQGCHHHRTGDSERPEHLSRWRGSLVREAQPHCRGVCGASVVAPEVAGLTFRQVPATSKARLFAALLGNVRVEPVCVDPPRERKGELGSRCRRELRRVAEQLRAEQSRAEVTSQPSASELTGRSNETDGWIRCLASSSAADKL